MDQRSILALSAFSSLTLLACSNDAPTPTEVRSKISSDLGNVLREAAAAAASRDAIPGTAALALVDRILGTNTQLPAMTAQLAGGLANTAGATTIDADAQIAYLNDKLFADANHVGDGVYRVPASLVCPASSLDPDGVDAMCAAQFAKLDLRIRTASEGGALVFAIQVDADHDEPLRLTLTHTSIALTVDLDDAQHAVVALASLAGQDAPNVAVSGQVTGKLEVLGAAKARVSITIDRALSIKAAKSGASLDGADAFVLTSARAEAVSLTLDGTAHAGALAIGLGETALKLPRIKDRRVELDLPGATATASFAAGQPLAFTHVGLGNRTTTLSVNGARAQTIDLNPSDGRAFDATVTDSAAGATLVVTPKLDLQTTVDHAVLGDTPPLYDTTGVVLDGSLRASNTSDQVEILSGAFSLTTTPASYGVSATAGQCVTATDATDPTTGAPFTRWTTGACH